MGVLCHLLSASLEAQGGRRTPALTLETCLSRGRSLWNHWGQKRTPFAKSDPIQSAPHFYYHPLPQPLKASQPTILLKPGMGRLHGLYLGVTSAPISPSSGGRCGRLFSLPGSPQPSAFIWCWFYNKMGKFFFINKGSLHRNGLPSRFCPDLNAHPCYYFGQTSLKVAS